MGKLDGQVALISGGARGQGEAQARLFAREGARVALADVLDAEGELVAASINDTGGDAVYHHLDVTERSQWRATVDAVVEQYGRLDILINNAGIARVRMIEDSTLEDYLEVIRVNQIGVWLGTQAAIPALKEAGGGCIINTSSVAGLRGYAGLGAYVSSKFAVRGITKVSAQELGQYNIRVNSVHPGPIDTPMIRDPEVSTRAPGDVSYDAPIPRVGTADEVAAMMLFIAADATYSTGSEFVIDGGAMAGATRNRNED